MRDYYALLQYVKEFGTETNDRTGVGTISSFGHQMRFDLRKDFPLLTGKFTSFKNIAIELLWFLQGNPNIQFLHDNNCHIWDDWVKEDGTFGPIYGKQWRDWNGTDQVQNVINRLKTDPFNRRLIISAWNVTDVESGEMALPPCHVFVQFRARQLSLKERRNWAFTNSRPYAFSDDESIQHEYLDKIGTPRYGLSSQLYQRSADMFLGVPYNIASYALLTHMIAHLTNMIPEWFIHAIGDAHIYTNHFDQVEELLTRDVIDYPLPQLQIVRDVKSIDDFKLDDFKIIGYNALPSIKAPVAV